MIKNSEKYSDFFTGEFLMGPNSVYLLDELLIKYPLELTRDDVILDVGCGKGLTSLFLANETGASVFANDLWISKEENQRRFSEWGVGEHMTASREDANGFNFEKEKFAAIVSVDAYHYFGGRENFFGEKMLPFIRPGGAALIAVPGVKDEFEGRQSELLGDWLGEEAGLLKSCKRWKELVGGSSDIKSLDVWEMENFAQAWRSWLSVDNEFAAGDRANFDEIIAKYTCFAGICVVKK